MTPLLIREATPDDLEIVADFNARLAIETEGKRLDPGVLREGVAIALADPDRLRYWLADAGGRVVGQAAVTREWSDWRNGWIWWFQSVYVDAEHRGRGVFRALYGHIRAIALEDPGVLGLRLYVEGKNEQAQATYKGLGMIPGGYEVYEELWPDRFKPGQRRS
ncbi:MAG: GNAT family N-acetyltransferase [Isosphaeraceae bacterium]